MDSDQLPCLDMDTDLCKAVMSGDMGYFNNPTHDFQSIPSKATSQQQNVLHIAADFKRIELAKYLVALFPVLLTRADLRGNTPLHIASKRGCSEIVVCFLEREVAEEALEMKNEMDDTAVHVAVRNGNLEVVKLLVQKNRKLLDLVNKNKESPLYLAVVRGFFEIAKFMLEGYSSVCSCEGTKGMTALHAAVIHTHKGPGVSESELSRENHRWSASDFFLRGRSRGKRFKDKIDILELLLKKKKDVIRQRDEFGWSPLHYAAHLGHHEATKQLLAVDGYVAGLCDVEQSCALHIAAKNGHSDVIEEIIACRPDAYNLVDNKGRTFLHIAAQFGKAGVVKYTLKKPNLESLINETDKEGNTALHLAAIHRQYWVVITLAADNRVDKRAINNGFLKTIDILQREVDAYAVGFLMVWAMMKLKHTGSGRRFRYFVVTRERTASNTSSSTHESTSDGGQSNSSASNPMSIDGKRKNREGVMEAEDHGESHRLKGVSKTNLLVAALIATVTFQAGMSPPGGFHFEGRHNRGAVWSTDKAFKTFSLANGTAFYFSAAALFIHFFASMRQNYRLRLQLAKLSSILIFASILFMMIAFSYSFYFEFPSQLSVSAIDISTYVLGSFCIVVLCYGLWNPKKLWN